MLVAYPVWLIRLTIWWLRSLPRRLRRPPAYVAFLVETPPREPPAEPIPLWQRLLGRPPVSLHDLMAQVRRVTAAPATAGVVLHLRPLPLSAAQVDALRELIAEVRGAGKRVVCWAPSYVGSTYEVACAADEVLLQPGGHVAPLGVARDYVFLAEALQRIGLEADLLPVSPYKTAGDALSKRGFTPEAREMAGWLADAAFGQLVAAVAAGRNLDEAAARALVDGSPYTDKEALDAALVDAVLVEDELPGRLQGRVMSFRAARARLPGPRPGRPGRYVALLRVEGLIVDGRSRRAPVRPPLRPPLLFEDQCGDLTVVEQVRAIGQNRRVGAAVLWVDSGGGSAIASEAIAAALTSLAREKPLVAAMGAVAASGGYYVTTPAARVFARPGTLTGSIGVLGGKMVAGGLLDRLLLHRETVQRGRHAAMEGVDQPYTEAERRKVRGHIARTYQLFLDRVAAARGRPKSEIEQVAGGRVWTGRQAWERGLVDGLGGLEDAAAEARRLAGLRADAPLRDVSGGRRDLPSPPATVPAMLEHALWAAAALDGAPAWLLCPLVGPMDAG